MVKPEVVSIVKATVGQALWLAQHLNPAEMEEVRALETTARTAVLAAVENSLHAWSAVSPEGVVCMWGITRQSSLLGGAIPWILTSTLIDKYARHFARRSVVILNELRKEYTFMEGLVDGKHERALRFLSWLGFTIEEGKILLGPEKLVMRKFTLGADIWRS